MPAQIVRAEIGVPQDAGEGALAQLLMKRYNQGEAMSSFLESDVPR
jgi:hypothetical protein